jgi:hypothetical protein
MDDWMLVLVVAGVALLGVVIGGYVQKICKFIFPTDFITISIMTVLMVNVILSFVPVDWFYYIPFVVGYMLGYLIVGRTTYTMVMTMSGPKAWRVQPFVLYEYDSKMYIQYQENRALADRLIWGIAHKIDCDDPIDDDCTLSYKRPMFPLFDDRMILLENIYTLKPEMKRGWLFRHNVYTPHFDVAYGSRASKAQLMFDVSTLHDMQLQIIDLLGQVHRLQQETGPRMLEHAMQIDQAAKEMTPANRMLSLAKSIKAAKENIPDVEEVDDGQR